MHPLKASPSLEGVVIDTKLFSRPKKDKDFGLNPKKMLILLRASTASNYWA
jgi:DNA-directed RNA polymerase subunit beta